MSIIRCAGVWIASGLASGVALSGLAHAQDTPALEEIVVTAQKREQSMQNVGISIAAFSGDQIKELNITNTVDIAQQVPGMQVTAWSPSFTVFSLRGVSQNSFQDNLEAPVAVYFDGAYVASMNAVNAQLFDIDRVEVLRGPQGTLFGRNATGGLIHFISHRPKEQEANGYLEAGAADFDTYSVEGAFGTALSERVRGRIAGRWENSDGYLKAGTAFDTPASGQTSQGADGYALRGMLQIDATDDVMIDLTAAYSKDDHVPTGQYVVTLAGFDPTTGLGAFTGGFVQDPSDPDHPIGPQDFPRTPITGDAHRHWSNEDTWFDRDSTSINAQVTADFDAVQFVSISNWLTMDKYYIEDAGGGFGFFPYTTIAAYDQWSQEFRLSGSTQRFRWQAGAYYLDMSWDTFQRVEGALFLGGTSDTQKLSTTGAIDSRNWSVFSQVEFDLTQRFTLIGGLRWSQDDKELAMNRVYEDVPNAVAPVETFNLSNVAIPNIDQIDYGDYAARLELDFKPNDDMLLYASINRGIKGGNWSLDVSGAVADEDLKHRPEKLTAVELGWKVDFWSGRARFNAAAFHYDYADYQAFSLVGLTPQVTNSDADANGGEIELTVTPARGLDVLFGASFIESTVDAVPDVFGGTVEAEFPAAPHVSLNMLARYEWPAFGGQLAAQVDGKWNDDQYLEGTNSEVSFEPAYSVWNASVSYATAGEQLLFTVYAKNALDEEYRVYNLDLGLLGFIEQAYAPPRQIGARVSYRW